MSYGASVSKSRSQQVDRSESKVITPKWYKPERRAYLADIARLRTASPYAGADLGLDPNTLALLPGGARDMAAGAREGAEENINSAFAAPGGPGMGSYAHAGALAGLQGQYAASVADATREATLMDATLRRSDYDRRLDAGERARNLALAFAARRGRTRGSISSISASASYSGTGGGGGGGTETSGGPVS